MLRLNFHRIPSIPLCSSLNRSCIRIDHPSLLRHSSSLSSDDPSSLSPHSASSLNDPTLTPLPIPHSTPPTALSSSLQLSPSSLSHFHEKGYLFLDSLIPRPHLSELGSRIEKLFGGRFETGVYPDDWGWRERLSMISAPREIINAWKSDRYLASFILSSGIGYIVAQLAAGMGGGGKGGGGGGSSYGTTGVRLMHDTITWKTPLGKSQSYHSTEGHMNHYFKNIPFGISVFISIDPVNYETGGPEFVPYSHLWGNIRKKIIKAGGNVSKPSTIPLSNHYSPYYHYRHSLRSMANELGLNVNEVLESIDCMSGGAGSIAIYHSHIWRGQSNNSSRLKPLRGIGMHFIPADGLFTEDAGFIYGRYR